MIDLLIETVHKIGTRSKRKVVGDIAKDIERVYGKERLLVEIASASINEPSGRICDVIFPIAGKAKLAAIVKEPCEGRSGPAHLQGDAWFLGQSLPAHAAKPAFRT
ncbi:hypothetical protein ACFSTI_34885 [Rhizorhabdus histidinilytica]